MKYCYKYIKHILEESELNIVSTIRNFRTVRNGFNSVGRNFRTTENEFNSVVKKYLTTATEYKNHSVTQSNQET